MLKNILYGAAVLTALLLGSGASAQEDTESDARQLLAILKQSDSLQGEFKQLQYDAAGDLQTQSSGQFKMLRPGYFSWEIRSPDKQLILATPEFIWHLDRDLETLTRRPVSKFAKMSPLQILGGSDDMLTAGFDIRKVDEQHYAIKPGKKAAASAGFVSLTITLSNDVVSGMEIIDALKQRIAISFQNLDRQTKLTATDFDFTPPEGVDLFYYDE